MNTKRNALIKVHLGYLCMGITPVFVKTLSWSVYSLVCARMLIGGIFLAIVTTLTKNHLNPSLKQSSKMLLFITFLLTIHWLTFFLSIKVSSIPIAVVSVSTIPLFAAIIEPLTQKKLPTKPDVLLGLLVVIGICIIVEDFSLESDSTVGMALGLFSALAKASRDVLSKPLIEVHGSMHITMFQLLIGGVLLSPLLILSNEPTDPQSISGVLTLGILGTGIAHSLSASGLKYITATTMTIIGTLASLYQIGFGVVLLQEIPTTRVVIGGVLIIAICSFETWRHSKQKIV